MTRIQDDALAPIGRLIEDRRRELGMTLKQVAEAAGLRVQTLQGLRYGRTIPNGLTRIGIERGLRWEPGSVDRFYRDGSIPKGAPFAGVTELVPARAPDEPPLSDDEARAAVIVAGIRELYPDLAELAGYIMGQKKPFEARERDLRAVVAAQAEQRALRARR
jgi:transcriptional regulator with XRE-family HTH domain